MNSQMRIVQCWDDAVTTDVRLVDLLKKYEARATFNLCIGLHRKNREFGWEHKGTEVHRLALGELKEVFEGFTIGNHSLTHPYLEQMPPEDAFMNIAEGREQLRQLFGQPVDGFAYPFGTYNEQVMDLARNIGHLYGRTIGNAEDCFPPADPMEFHPTCHFLAPDFLERYEKAKQGGVFYFWGHSFEMITESMWRDFEGKIRHMNDDPESCWADIPDLFACLT